MSNNYGIKTSRAGFDVKTALPYQLSFSSKYQTLKVLSNHSGSISDSTGRTVTIAHNLGYVPMFIAHANPFSALPNDYFTLPFVEGGTVFEAGRTNMFAYADSTNVYIKVHQDYGYHYEWSGTRDENYSYEYEAYGSGCDNALFVVGYNDDGWLNVKGGIRADSISVVKEDDVYKANIGIYIGNRYTSNTIFTKLYGIDTDDVGDFGCATNQSKTTASRTESIDGGLQAGATWTPDVTSMFNEIINRAGWATGNAMGFIIENNGTTGTENHLWSNSNCYIRWLPANHLVDYKCTIFKNKIDYS